ncbi:MAG TPA: alpha/beta hydrolase-fold protein [Ferruginibacter sp.]|nr:alpha/beta hydrolase-fold protein [Ferruginibacter sp.]HRE63253.1 alpha/beta hydrolase-fold protein [Ferruginibacter sp.]
MFEEKVLVTTVEQHLLHSENLRRIVKVDCYLPPGHTPKSLLSLLLINDGQDLVKMGFENILDSLYSKNGISEIFCVGLQCATDRKNEYGTAKILDYKGRGAKAFLYTKFIFLELIPFLKKTYKIDSFYEKAFAGFSLGGLCALDIVWNYPHEFTKVGVFSGSLWWRDVDQDDKDFDEEKHRIMHRQVREGSYASWLKFFFEVGTLDETADRNHNGVIDAIDDTVSFIDELVKKGYSKTRDVKYLELADGRHDVPTWARAFPDFLKWGWGINKEVDD